ncbi:hypothetical protein [Salinirubrum litoreum]|uniref:Uncharacterized protein n=1 Tax=Salinirubrum litoreum TaxID=1126234 RepID=A0ABD5REM6_9EURY|nr:hypothetical protein [Salinirubrum litoreum]
MASRLGAVGAGVGLALALELVVYLLSGRVSVGGGLLGSAVAGWLVTQTDATGATDRRVASDTAAGVESAVHRGAVVGLLVACVVALAVVPAGVVLTLATGETRLVPFGLVIPRLGSPALIAVVVGCGVTLPNALLGAVAGVLGAERHRLD